jgi:hypothetical protein
MHVGGLDLLILEASQHRQLQSPATMPVSTDVPDSRSRSDCEDRFRSLMVVGCGLVTAGVTPGVTGFAPLVRHVRSRLLAPVRLKELA